MTEDYDVAGLVPGEAIRAKPIVQAGEPTENGTQIKDNRLHLDVDPKRIESWELMAMEDDNAKIQHLILIFCRYVADGSGYLSPDIPNKPIDELSAREIAEIKASKAYRALKRFKLPTLRDAALSFATQARAALDPK